MAQIAPYAAPGNVNEHVPPPELAPGVYFLPSPEECVQLLDRYIAGHDMREYEGGNYRPGNTRDPSDPKWWFFSHYKLQSAGGTRGDRAIGTGGYWKMDQSKTEVRARDAAGAKSSLGFYVGKGKMPWLMEEYTTTSGGGGASVDADGRNVVLVLCKIYSTPNEKKKRKREAADGAEEMPARVMGPDDVFDAVAERLPPSSVRGIFAPPPPPATSDVLGHYDYQGQLLDAAGVYQGQFLDDQSMPTGQFLAMLNEEQGIPIMDQFLAITAKEQSSSAGDFPVNENAP